MPGAERPGPAAFLSGGSVGRWNRMFRVASDRPDPYFSTGIPRRPGSACRYRTLARRVLLRPGARFSDTESTDTQVGIVFAVRCTLYPESRNPAPHGADGAIELLPGAFRSGPGHGFRIPNLRYAGRYLICCPMHAIPGIPRRTGSGCRYRNSCPARLAPARGTVFGYRYEKRCLFRFIRNISFPGSLRAAREWMPLLKLLPGGVSPRPGTSGFFIPSPACRFSPARC